MNAKSDWVTSLIGSASSGSEKLRALKLSSDGKFVFAGTDSSFVCLDALTGKELRRQNAVHKGAISKVATSAFNNWIATYGQDNKVIVWEMADIQPYKRFTLGIKAPPFEMCFNRNETMLYLLTPREIVCIALKGETTDKEIKRVPLPDKEAVAGCLIEKLGIFVLADSSNSLVAVDLDRFERVTLCQKLSSVNALRYFENDDTLWAAYSNNLLGVYELTDSGLINFNALERRAPFEILTLEQVSDELVAAGGFHNQVCLLSSLGHVVTSLLTLPNAILLRHFCVQPKQNQLFVGTDSQVECFDLVAAHNETFLGDYSIKVNDLCTVEVTKAGIRASNADRKNTTFKLNGLVRSAHFCKDSFLAVLYGEAGATRVQLVDWKMIEKSLGGLAEEEALEDKFDVVFNRFADKFDVNEENPSILQTPAVPADSQDPFAGEFGASRKLGLKRPDPSPQALLKDFIPLKIHGRLGDLGSKTASKIRILKGDSWLEEARRIFVGGSNLYFVLPQRVVQTDFSLRVLHIWNQPSPVTATDFLENVKRKESLIVGLQSGEVFRIAADNSFPVLVVDHKLPVQTLQVSKGRDKLLLLDANSNASVYDLGTLQNSKPLSSVGGVAQTGFSRSASDLFYTLDTEGALTVAYESASVVFKGLVEKGEKICDFRGSDLVAVNPLAQTVRTIELNLSQIYSRLIRDKRAREAFELMTFVGASQSDFKKLGISALRSGVHESFVLQSFLVSGNAQLLQLAREHLHSSNSRQSLLSESPHNENLTTGTNRTAPKTQSASGNTKDGDRQTIDSVIQANLDKEEQLRLQAELLAADGKVGQAIEVLLKEKQPGVAIDILVTMGKYEQAVKILRNPLHSGSASLAKFDLKKIIKLQGEEALRRNDIPKAIEYFLTVKEFDVVVELLIRREKSQDLITLVRDQPLAALGKPALVKASEYFQKKNHLPYAKECLKKAEDDELMIDLLVEFECFEEALEVAKKLGPRVNQAGLLEKVYLPYANLLLSENRFEDALAIYLKTGDLQFCHSVLTKMTFVNTHFKNFELAAQLHFFRSKLGALQARGAKVDSQTLLKSSEDHEAPLESLFYLTVSKLHEYDRKIEYRDYAVDRGLEESGAGFTVGCVLLVLNLLRSFPHLRFPGDLAYFLQKATETAWRAGRRETAKYLLGQLEKIDPHSPSVTKYAFLGQVAGAGDAALSKSDFFFECVNCETRGFETTGLSCPDCSVRLIFCPLSGRQIRLIPVTLAKALQSQGESNLNWFKSFGNKLAQTSRTKWSENEDDEFLAFVRDNIKRNLNDGRFTINTQRTQELMSLRRTVFLQGPEYLYWARNSSEDSLVFCGHCRTMVEGQAFEEFADPTRCLCCGSSEFKSAVNV